MALLGLGDFLLDLLQVVVNGLKINLFLRLGGADVAGDIEIEVILLDFRHVNTAGITRMLRTLTIRVDDIVDVLWQEAILTFSLFEVLGRIYEKHVVGPLTLLQHQNAHRDVGGVEQVGWQADQWQVVK
jgi:hypothetical protein